MLGSNPTVRLQADMVVHAAGRVPQIDDLNLDRAGVEWDKRGVRVNEFLQSVSNPGVMRREMLRRVGGPPSPVASYEGRVVTANLLKGNHQTANYLGVPPVVFTIPILTPGFASFGAGGLAVFATVIEILIRAALVRYGMKETLRSPARDREHMKQASGDSTFLWGLPGMHILCPNHPGWRGRVVMQLDRWLRLGDEIAVIGLNQLIERACST